PTRNWVRLFCISLMNLRKVLYSIGLCRLTVTVAGLETRVTPEAAVVSGAVGPAGAGAVGVAGGAPGAGLALPSDAPPLSEKLYPLIPIPSMLAYVLISSITCR